MVPATRFSNPFDATGPWGEERDDLLLPGVNISSWPALKIGRSQFHLGCLFSSFQLWGATAPVAIKSRLGNDRKSIDLVAEVPISPPTHEWSLSFGDLVHNARASFDALAWELAHHAGATPERPRHVQFPLCSREKDWLTVKNDWLKAAPTRVIERIAAVQPYQAERPGAMTILELLHELDIQDKHRTAVQLRSELTKIDIGGFYRLRDPEGPHNPRLEMRDVPMVDGVTIGTLLVDSEIESSDTLVLRPTLAALISVGDQETNLLDLATKICDGSRHVLQFLLTGGDAPPMYEYAQQPFRRSGSGCRPPVRQLGHPTAE